MRRQVCFAFAGFNPDNDDLSDPTQEEIAKWTVPIDLQVLSTTMIAAITRYIFVDKNMMVFTPCAFDNDNEKFSWVELKSGRICFPNVDDDWFNPEEKVRVLVPFNDDE